MKGRTGTFMMASQYDGKNERIEWPYVNWFEWMGITFVVHRPLHWAGDGPEAGWGWKVSHKDSGYSVGGAVDTQGAAIVAARITLDEHPIRAKRIIEATTAKAKRYKVVKP